MSWTARESKTSHDSINTYDSVTGPVGVYTGAVSQSCSSELLILLTAIKGAGAFVQGDSDASASGGSATISKAFPGNNTAGNCIVVDASMSGLFGPLATTAACVDSQGNTYVQAGAEILGGGNTIAFTFVAFGIAGGANTPLVTFTPGFSDPPGPVTIAVHEYTGGSSVDAFGGASTATATTTASLTTTAAGDVLHMAVFIAPACGGSPFNPVGGGTNPPTPPAITGGTPTPTQPFFANLAPPPLQTPIVDVNAQQANVPYPLRGVPSGDLTNAWAGWFMAVYQFLEANGLAGAAGSLGASTITAATTLPGPGVLNPYTGQIIALNSATPQTLTLSSPPPNGTWNVFIQNIGVGTWTIDPNGLMLDGGAASLVLNQNQGVYLSTDGVNYFTDRGMGGGATNGGVNKQTTSYTAVAGDNGKIISFSDASAVTLTLPAAPPSAQWNVFVENVGAGTLTVSRNGLTIDGAASNLTVITNAGVYISTDGSNYFTERGLATGTVTHTGGALTADQPVFGAGGSDVKVGTKSGNTDEIATVSGSLTSGHGIVSDASGNLVDSGGTPFTNPMTTKGDVIVGATSGVPARLAVGANGKVLTANSAATNGVDYEAPIALTTTGTSGAAVLTPGNPYSLNIPQYSGGGGSGALTQIAQTVLASPAASVTFSAIPGTFTNLLLVISARSAAAVTTDNIKCAINADAVAAHYVSVNVFFTTGTVSASQNNLNVVGVASGASSLAGGFADFDVLFRNYAGGALKNFTSQGTVLDGTTFATTSIAGNANFSAWDNTAAITSLVLTLTSAGNFVTGSVFTLYGLQ